MIMKMCFDGIAQPGRERYAFDVREVSTQGGICCALCVFCIHQHCNRQPLRIWRVMNRNARDGRGHNQRVLPRGLVRGNRETAHLSPLCQPADSFTARAPHTPMVKLLVQYVMRGGREVRNKQTPLLHWSWDPRVSTEAMVRLPKQPEPDCGFIIQQEIKRCMVLRPLQTM